MMASEPSNTESQEAGPANTTVLYATSSGAPGAIQRRRTGRKIKSGSKEKVVDEHTSTCMIDEEFAPRNPNFLLRAHSFGRFRAPSSSDLPRLGPRFFRASSGALSRTSSIQTAASLVKTPPHAAGPPRVLEILKVEIMQLTNVDVQAQCFDVQFAIEATFVNGAKDTDLRREGCEFPLDADGRPTFRPSAGWFLSKMDFNNALSHELIESSVKVNNDNLDTILYIKGTFFESLELCRRPHLGRPNPSCVHMPATPWDDSAPEARPHAGRASLNDQRSNLSWHQMISPSTRSRCTSLCASIAARTARCQSASSARTARWSPSSSRRASSCTRSGGCTRAWTSLAALTARRPSACSRLSSSPHASPVARGSS